MTKYTLSDTCLFLFFQHLSAAYSHEFSLGKGVFLFNIPSEVLESLKTHIMLLLF